MPEHSKDIRTHYGERAKEQLAAVSKVFDDRLRGNGSVGLSRIAPASELQHLSELKPSLLRVLEDITKRHGLREEAFTEARRQGLPQFSGIVKLKEKMKELHEKKTRSK